MDWKMDIDEWMDKQIWIDMFLNMRSCLFLWTCETSLPKNPRNFQNITVNVSWNVVFKSFSGENVV